MTRTMAFQGRRIHVGLAALQLHLLRPLGCAQAEFPLKLAFSSSTTPEIALRIMEGMDAFIPRLSGVT